MPTTAEMDGTVLTSKDELLLHKNTEKTSTFLLLWNVLFVLPDFTFVLTEIKGVA